MRLTVINILLLLSLSLNAQMAGRTMMDTDDGGPAPPTYLSLAHYSMNGDGVDATGHGYTATTANVVYATNTPAAGSHYCDFSTQTPEFRTPAGMTFGSTFFMAFWFRQNASGGFYEFVDAHRDNSSFEHFFVWARGDNHAFEFRGYQDGTNSLDIANSVTSVWTSAFVWNQLIFTWDGTGANGIVTMFYNGVEVTMSNDETWNAANMTIDDVQRIGESFSGHIDEVTFGDFIPNGTQKLLMWNGGTPGYIL